MYVRGTPEERFWAKVVKTDTCWLWTGAQKKAGYGRFRVNKERVVLAHRFAYELLIGSVPDGEELDHVCMVKQCVRPDGRHVQSVTHLVNVQRAAVAGLFTPEIDRRRGHKTHCPHGHPYAGENLRIGPDGKRYCRACNRHRECRTVSK